VQEVFLRILKYRHTFRADSQFQLDVLCGTQCQIDHFRKNKHADEARHESEDDVFSEIAALD
jgi:DNA-directed RNA polymerase specialized sigma24 family protein